MDELIAALQPTVDRFGGVGMALIAALDTSFVSMPTVSDLLLVWQTIRLPHLWWYYALMTTLGSVVGSMAIYYIGRFGGGAILLKRFRPERVAQVRGLFAQYGVWAMLVVAFLPPPTPYKIFVLLAGAGGVGPAAFAIAVAAGRGLRHLAEGWFAQAHGQETAQFIRLHLAEATIWTLAVVSLLGVVWWMWSRRQTGVQVRD